MRRLRAFEVSRLLERVSQGILVAKRERRARNRPLIVRYVWDGSTLLQEGLATFDSENVLFDDRRYDFEGKIRGT